MNEWNVVTIDLWSWKADQMTPCSEAFWNTGCLIKQEQANRVQIVRAITPRCVQMWPGHTEDQRRLTGSRERTGTFCWYVSRPLQQNKGERRLGHSSCGPLVGANVCSLYLHPPNMPMSPEASFLWFRKEISPLLGCGRHLSLPFCGDDRRDVAYHCAFPHG